MISQWTMKYACFSSLSHSIYKSKPCYHEKSKWEDFICCHCRSCRTELKAALFKNFAVTVMSASTAEISEEPKPLVSKLCMKMKLSRFFKSFGNSLNFSLRERHVVHVIPLLLGIKCIKMFQIFFCFWLCKPYVTNMTEDVCWNRDEQLMEGMFHIQQD